MRAQVGSGYFANIKNSTRTIWHGMSITLSYMFRRPITVQYPDRTEVPVRDTLPDRYRGFLEVDMDICTACQACQKDCPIDCIRIDIEGKGKERYMTRFDIDIAKCMFCGLCTENCPTGAIQHTPEFEASALAMENLTFRFISDPVQGVPPYKVEKGVDSYQRKPLGSILSGIIKPWDAPPPVFPDPEPEPEPEAAPEAEPALEADAS
ncbi:MAG: NADH-quinone oxidoreductase subunit I [Deltaproteobacteria bacterium]|nr:NADH-quinone oxidoreductase subunit I [Deltaproteobacteria bacterium]